MKIKSIFILYLIILFPSFSNAQPTNCESARSEYLKINPDVARAGMDPWSHYQTFGKNEGRKWPNCKSTESISLNEKTTLSTNENLKYDYKVSNLNTNGSFLTIGGESDLKEKIKILNVELRKYDSLNSLVTKYRNYYIYKGNKININDDDVAAVEFYQDKKLFYLKPHEWYKFKDKLIKMGFDPNRLSERDCKLYFAFNEKENKYMEVPYFELQELYGRFSFRSNDYNRNHKNCVLKKRFQKFLKKNPEIFVEIADTQKKSILFNLTNIDDSKNFIYLKKNIQEIEERVAQLAKNHHHDLGNNYFYWGEKSNYKAQGIGIIIRKSNYNILTVGKWEMGEPNEILAYYLYNNNQEYQLKGTNKIFQIIGTPNQTKSYFYFGEYVKNYNGYEWVRNGYGDYVWSESKYSGKWQYGERTGYATFIYNLGSVNETKYVGNFLNGNFNGYGEEFDINGNLKRSGIWEKNKFIKTNDQMLVEQKEEEDRQQRLAQEAKLLTSGNFDKELENVFNDLIGKAIYKKALGQNVNTKDLLNDCLLKVENDILNHKMSIEEKKYFSAYGEKKFNKLSAGLDMYNAISKNSGNQSSNNSTNYGSNTNPSEQNCLYCRGNGLCSDCNKEFKFRIWDGKKYEYSDRWSGHWEDVKETKPGWIKCTGCSGYGLNWTYNDAPVSKKCYVNTCNGGWIRCSKCYSDKLGKCTHCKGTGKQKR